MNNKLIATTFAILASVIVSIASIALVVGLSQTANIQAADAPQGNNVYLFAEGVSPTATFTFGDKTEVADFQLISQTQGVGNNGRGTSPEFTLTKIAGGTPYLYAAVDEDRSCICKKIEGKLPTYGRNFQKTSYPFPCSRRYDKVYR